MGGVQSTTVSVYFQLLCGKKETTFEDYFCQAFSASEDFQQDRKKLSDYYCEKEDGRYVFLGLDANNGSYEEISEKSGWKYA